VIQEQTLTLGPEGRLVATLTLPQGSAGARGAPTALLTNSGVISRVGPYRLNVRIARRLAARGIASIRFDLSGLGDSRRAPGTRPQLEQWAEDTRAVMDWAANRLGSDAFFMVGFCSGAEVALRCALADPRMRGVLLWDMYAYPTVRSRSRALAYRLRRAGAMGLARKVAARAGRLLGRTPSPEGEERQLAVLEPSRIPPIEQHAADLQSLVDRGTQVLIMFCGGEPEWYNYPGQFRDAMARFPGVLRGVACECLMQSNHLLTQSASRDAFVASLERWLDEAVLPGLAAPLPAPPKSTSPSTLSSPLPSPLAARA
jgi:pimeloyl-ACP methyl ester carboxylesterase